MNDDNLKPFKKGKSGNPSGRPKEVAEVKALALWSGSAMPETRTQQELLLPSPCSTGAGASQGSIISTKAIHASTSFSESH